MPLANRTGLQTVCYNQTKSFAFVFENEDSAKWFIKQSRAVGLK